MPRRQKRRMRPHSEPKVSSSFLLELIWPDLPSPNLCSNLTAGLWLRPEYKNGRKIVVVSGSRDVIAIEFLRPKRRSGTGPRGNLARNPIAVCVFLLIRVHVSGIESSAS